MERRHGILFSIVTTPNIVGLSSLGSNEIRLVGMESMQAQTDHVRSIVNQHHSQDHSTV